MPFLFSYGTLQREDVQLSTFGRLLTGAPDELTGFELSAITIDGTRYSTVTFSRNPDIRIPGVLFEVSDSELARADEYEGEVYYKRVIVTLASGKQAWVYAHNR
jgi:gamma-glutamylcyclotransferase (GGCT)/AIG2-like uncharacterized protein YtfP